MSMDFQAGTRIGEYVLDSYVGGGSFGAVWRGHQSTTGQLVAIKLLTGALAADSMATRADVEVLAQAAAQRSPHVVKVLGGGLEPSPYIVMEFIEGKDLQTLLREQGQLGAELTIEVGLAISDALRALYQAGIVHRDIKPANVMIDKDAVIKLADFGIAKIVGYDTITMAGQAAMTMAYAAPEIWDENGAFGRPSHRSDLYAMGVLLYQCLTGFTPFRGNYGALYKAHMEQPPDISALPPATPASLRILITRCLEKKQDDRPRDAAECIAILRRAQAELASSSGDATISEPKKLGPWLKNAPHETLSWAWRCQHESSGRKATVEVHFADNLDYGERFRRAIAANPKLTPFGAERLIDSNRLLLHPNESWWAPPAGEFQFWVAREDLEVSPAATVSEAMLRTAVHALVSLIDAAKAANLTLDLRGENLVMQQDGTVYLRRPGLVEPVEEAGMAALAWLRGLALDPTAREHPGAARDLEDLSDRLGEYDEAATIIARPPTPTADATQVVQRASPPPPPAAEPAPVRAPPAPAAEVPSPPRSWPAPSASAPPPARTATPPPATKAQPPYVLIAGGVGAVMLIGVLAFLAFGQGGGSKSSATVREVDKSAATSAPPVIVNSTPSSQTSPSSGARPQGRERLIDSILVETDDTNCSDGTPGCRLVYSVGPFRFRDNTLRIEYVLQLVAPNGKGVEWTDDMTVDREQAAKGEHGTILTGESGKAWRIVAAGGIAAQSNPSLPAGRYTGYWDFVFEEEPGTTLSLDYPDFSNYITVVVPP